MFIEICQTEKDIYCRISLTFGNIKKIKQLSEYNNKEHHTHRYRKQISGCQWEEEKGRAKKE